MPTARKPPKGRLSIEDKSGRTYWLEYDEKGAYETEVGKPCFLRIIGKGESPTVETIAVAISKLGAKRRSR